MNERKDSDISSIVQGSPYSEAIEDFRCSWKLFKENFRSFIFTEFFALFAFLIIIALIAIGMYFYLIQFSPEQIPSQINSNVTTMISVGIYCGFILFFGFISCQFGLAYDIFSSGDMFAEFKGAFTYYKRFWWQYPLLTFVLFGLSVSPTMQMNDLSDLMQIQNGTISNYPVVISYLIIIFIWFVCFIEIMPSLTAQGHILTAFKENFYILRHNFKRVLISWGIFAFIVCLLLIGAFSFLFSSFNSSVTEIPILNSLVFVIFVIAILFLSIPFIALISTRIYNTAVGSLQKTNQKIQFKD